MLTLSLCVERDRVLKKDDLLMRHRKRKQTPLHLHLSLSLQKKSVCVHLEISIFSVYDVWKPLQMHASNISQESVNNAALGSLAAVQTEEAGARLLFGMFDCGSHSMLEDLLDTTVA